jgi:hypothetical protein
LHLAGPEEEEKIATMEGGSSIYRDEELWLLIPTILY